MAQLKPLIIAMLEALAGCTGNDERKESKEMIQLESRIASGRNLTSRHIGDECSFNFNNGLGPQMSPPIFDFAMLDNASGNANLVGAYDFSGAQMYQQ